MQELPPMAKPSDPISETAKLVLPERKVMPPAQTAQIPPVEY